MPAFAGLSENNLPPGVSLYRGKVRDVINTGTKLVFVTTDRISAFDRNLGCIEGKGEVLNQLSLYWFRETRDILENHIVEEISPRATAVRKADMLPVEVIVRGYLTGSAWRDYSSGRSVPGLELPAGMRAHQRLPQPAITPTTKEAVGEHDQPIGRDEILRRGLVAPEVWQLVEQKALALYTRGRDLLARRGLILVDTKYEFGLIDGRLILCDEIHTPDCSRFWFADDYENSFAQGREPRKLDKEYFRSWLTSQGFDGTTGDIVIPEKVFLETMNRYLEAYEMITGQKWHSKGLSLEAEMQIILSSLSK